MTAPHAVSDASMLRMRSPLPVARRRCRTVIAAALFTLLAVREAAACAVCFSTSDPSVVSSLNAGIFVLLGVTAVVLAGFVRFIVSVARRANSMPLLDIEEPQG